MGPEATPHPYFAVFASAPAVSSITPDSGASSGAVSITDLAGTGFRCGAAVALKRAGQPDIPATGVNVVSGSRITCAFDLTDAAPGAWDVVVTNSDGQSGTLAGGFRVDPAIWYLAEGATAGDFDTWVLVQNPNPDPVTVDLTFMTGSGPLDGPQDFPIPGNSRESFHVNEYVSDYKVSTKVTSEGGSVICERAMYNLSRTWAHDSVGYSP